MRKLLILLLFCSFLRADTHTATTCSSAHVQEAIDAASDADTVAIPYGSCTWETSVTIPNTKGLIIQGSGTGNTIITDGLPSHGYLVAPLSIEATSGKFTRVTAISFIGTADSTNGSICIHGTTGGQCFRIDHCEITTLARAVKVQGYIFGVIDNCTITAPNNTTAQGISIIADGETAWARPLGLGSGDFIFIEDCVFNYSYLNDGALDAYNGARYVVRNNTINGTAVAHHGNDSGGYRSTHSYEIYNNVFANTGTAIYTVMATRGGTGVVYGNTITGNWNDFYRLNNYRSCPYFDGSHTGGATAYLEDSTANFDGGSNPVSDNSHYVYNQTDGSYCKITSHTATTITCALSGGTDNSWANGDRYSVVYFYNPSGACTGFSSADGNTSGGQGYPCQDQVGRTTGQLLSPLYLWGNSYKGDTSPLCGQGGNCVRQQTYHILASRDYYDNTQMPGYAAYTYPHPLRGETASTGGVSSRARLRRAN